MKQVFLRVYFWLKAALSAFRAQRDFSLDSAESRDQQLAEHKEMLTDVSSTQEQNPLSGGVVNPKMSFKTKITKRVYDLYSKIVLKRYERRIKKLNKVKAGEKLKVKWMKDLALILPKAKIDKIVFTIFVEQPIAGLALKMNMSAAVGHSFVGLKIFGKSSKDIINHVFGYYPSPDRQKILSATPFENRSESCFLDDSSHLYHLSLSKEISLEQHLSILDKASQFEQADYDLCRNNCTDFVIEAARLADIVIHKTAGDWGVGQGNNPADLGQAILFGLFYNKATKSTAGILLDKRRVEWELGTEPSNYTE